MKESLPKLRPYEPPEISECLAGIKSPVGATGCTNGDSASADCESGDKPSGFNCNAGTIPSFDCTNGGGPAAECESGTEVTAAPLCSAGRFP